MQFVKSKNGRSHWAKDEDGNVFIITKHYNGQWTSVGTPALGGSFMRFNNKKELVDNIRRLQSEIKNLKG